MGDIIEKKRKKKAIMYLSMHLEQLVIATLTRVVNKRLFASVKLSWMNIRTNEVVKGRINRQNVGVNV